MKLEALRKQLPSRPALKPLTPTLDHLFNLVVETHTHPQQKWIDLGWLSANGTPLTWDFWQSKAPERR
jgi:hypothetical protein